MEPAEQAIETFEAARPLLTGLAYRILGSYAEAEDVVQDTFLSWMAAEPAAIERPRSWLTAVCTRKAVDVLRSARRARTTYVGAWLPEPVHTEVLDTPEGVERAFAKLDTIKEAIVWWEDAAEPAAPQTGRRDAPRPRRRHRPRHQRATHLRKPGLPQKRRRV